MNYTGYSIYPYGRKCTKVLYYYRGDLVDSYIVFAHFRGGDIVKFIEDNKHIRQFVLDF